MKKFRFFLSATLALAVGLFVTAGAAAVQAAPQSPAPSGLNAELCQPSGQHSVCLSWSPGSDDYVAQEIRYWETGSADTYPLGSVMADPNASRMHILISNLNQSGNQDGDVAYTFQVVGVKDGGFAQVFSGYSNKATVEIPGYLLEIYGNYFEAAPSPLQPAQPTQPLQTLPIGGL